MLIYIYLSVFLSLLGILMFVLKRKHLLIMLLSLEFIVVSLYFSIMIYLSEMSYEFLFSLIFLTMSVFEGVSWTAASLATAGQLQIRAHGNSTTVKREVPCRAL